MKSTRFFQFFPLAAALMLIMGCGASEQADDTQSPPAGNQAHAGQSAVKDEVSNPNVVQVAMGSEDHSTLVAAVQAAELVDVLSNVGPFTVFAPVNSAFDALPAGTVDKLLKKENKAQLADILEYHVYVGVIREHLLRDGMVLNQVNGGNVTISKDGDTRKVNGASILAAIEASNGIIYVIDQVLLPS